jgi:hypothetical protein
MAMRSIKDRTIDSPRDRRWTWRIEDGPRPRSRLLAYFEFEEKVYHYSMVVVRIKNKTMGSP